MNNMVAIVTGELSGEAHAAHLVRAVNALSPMRFSGMGSQTLSGAGVDVIQDYREISITGMSIPLFLSKANLIRRAFRTLKEHLATTRPGLLILVDFPGFNLRLARLAKRLAIPVVYFVAPQVWAWHRGRVRQIKANVDLVLSILPFDEPFFQRFHIPVSYVGHPYAKGVKPVLSKEDFFSACNVAGDGPVITIMPGSRQSEARRHMPILMEVLERLDRDVGRYTALLPVADTLAGGFFDPFLKGRTNVIPVRGLAHDCLAYSDIALIASGSATLEAAILGVPSLVFYKISLPEYLAARAIVKVPYISLPNIIAGKEVFPEFVRSVNPERIAKAAVTMLHNGRSAVQKDLEEIRSRLSAPSGSDPYQTAAKAILRLLEHRYGPLPQAP